MIDAGPRSFQPMNVNFGLFPPIAEPRFDEAGKRLAGPARGLARKRALSARAEQDLARLGRGGASKGAIRSGLRPPTELHGRTMVNLFGFSWFVAISLRKTQFIAV